MGIFLSSSTYAFFILVLAFTLSLRRVLEEAPLMTQSLREAQKKEKIDKYPKVSLFHVQYFAPGPPVHVANSSWGSWKLLCT